jgi:mRNA interferase MazF
VELKSGQILVVDWRKDPRLPDHDPLHPEPNKRRPAVVVQDTELFDPSYPTVLVVPLTGDRQLAIPELTVELQPSAANGCSKVSYLLPQNITCIAKSRIAEATDSHITASELQQLRQLVALTVGVFG